MKQPLGTVRLEWFATRGGISAIGGALCLRVEHALGLNYGDVWYNRSPDLPLETRGIRGFTQYRETAWVFTSAAGLDLPAARATFEAVKTAFFLGGDDD